MTRRLVLAESVLATLAAAAGAGICGYSRVRDPAREIDRLIRLTPMQPGMTVAEIGAGRGRMAVLLARRLGPSSRIYATEIEPEKQNAIRSAAAGLASFSVLPAAESSVNLPEACCDAIYLRRVYHHLSDSAAINRSLYLSLRAGGRLAIIDMLTPRWIFWTRHGIPAETVVAQVTAAGFRLERRVDRWSPIDYCLVFQKVPRGP